MKRFLSGMLVVFMAALYGCGGGDGTSSSPPPANSNSTVGAPASITGKTLVETVSRSGYVPSSPGSTINITQPGGKITYSFIDANTILGAGVTVVPTLSWNYGLYGNVATVDLHMQYGDTRDILTFTSPTGGNFRSDGTLVSGTTFWFEGTFTTSPYINGGNNSSITLTGMSPSTGVTGTTVTITGTNFSTSAANNTVRFNGTTATVTAATTTSLTVKVPAGATTGPVTVTTAGSTATSAGSFTVSPTSTTVNLYILYATPTANNPTGAKEVMIGTCSATAPNSSLIDVYSTLPGYSSFFFQMVSSGLSNAQCLSIAQSQYGLDSSLMF